MANTAARLRGDEGAQGDRPSTGGARPDDPWEARTPTDVAVEHQHHGDSRTEAALFNVNIDLF